jgi:hypothetical protein
VAHREHDAAGASPVGPVLWCSLGLHRFRRPAVSTDLCQFQTDEPLSLPNGRRSTWRGGGGR